MAEALNPPWPRALLATQSLTAALKATGAAFAVRVRFQGETEALFARERLAARHYAREVELLLDGVAVVWARSVCDAASQRWREVLACGEQPLGAKLFGGEVEAKRSDFVYFTDKVPGADAPVWMRASRFVCAGETLLLTEAFLPALAAFLPGEIHSGILPKSER